MGETIKRLMRLFALALIFLLAGCGLKTGLIVYDDLSPEPQLASISHQVIGNAVQIQLSIIGGSDTVVYQIDRAKVDPDCKCVNDWLRYYESSPSTQRHDLKRNIKLQHVDETYAFRVRVMDSLGRKSDWSKVFQVKAE
ncbi:MAG: hypothetical protein Q9N67_06390 [Ghiorsea sp.]|nr:hypothetical protein [Ghiorsea sp.]